MENRKRKELEKRREALRARLALRRDLDKVLRYARGAVFSNENPKLQESV